MRQSVCNSINSIDAMQWNALTNNSNPFLRYEFLFALEQHDCLEKWGWRPQHICIYDKRDKLVGAAPMYLKDNSYGEFVFDSAWADAYARAGLAYYPKLVVSIPYTPVTGNRLLVDSNQPAAVQIRQAIVDTALQHANKLKVSSLHWLFSNEEDTALLEKQNLLRRTGCQFHWQNNAYKNFDAFLASLTSKKRKQIRRERRLVREAGIKVELLHGNDTTDQHWQIFHEFYTSTFRKKGGYATLTLDFFKTIAQTMPDNVVLVLAKRKGEYIAGTFNMRGDNSLFGRHWGCRQDFSGLHFELCYYRLIEYCIEQGLERFEAGAQGEHKISRGFLPRETWSAHWLADPGFREVIAQFLIQEREGVQHYMQVLEKQSPFRKTGN